MKVRIFTIMFCLAMGLAALLDSCKNESTPTTSEHITTLRVVAQNLTTNVTDTFTYVNYNQTKSSPPSLVDTLRLQANSSYAIQVVVLNETLSPAQNMTDTIEARGDNHLMIYNIDPTALFSLRIQDKDSKGLPIGLMSTWTTTNATNGWLRMILLQQPGNKNGTQTPGITDFEADFPVVVK